MLIKSYKIRTALARCMAFAVGVLIPSCILMIYSTYPSKSNTPTYSEPLAVGQIWGSISDNPFDGGFGYAFRVRDLRADWVQYELINCGCDGYIDSERIFSFTQFNKKIPLRDLDLFFNKGCADDN